MFRFCVSFILVLLLLFAIICKYIYTHTRIQITYIKAEVLISPDSFVRCRRLCKKILSCGNHQCKVQCCPGKRIEGYHGHICQEICGRKLNCGKHFCDSRCHAGPCNPCGVTYRQGVQCACGAVYVPGPFRCGTKKIPKCTRKCDNFLPCGHNCYSLCHEGLYSNLFVFLALILCIFFLWSINLILLLF